MAAAGFRSPGNPIRDHLASLLTDYQRIRQEDPFTSHPLQAAMRDLKKRVETSEVVAQHPDLLVKASVGQGGWAETPAVALWTRRATKTARRGLSVSYRFRPDESAMYLILGRGVAEATDDLRQQVAAHRRTIENSQDLGFTLADLSGLTAKSLDDKKSASTVIAHKGYARGQVPDDATLLADLRAILTAYQQCITVTKDGWMDARW